MSVKESPSPPKVLHVVSADLWADAEVQLVTLAKTLHSKVKVPVSVILLNHDQLENRLRNADTKTIVYDENKLNGLQILRKLIYIIRDLNPDVVHTHRSKENILGSLAALLAGRIPSMRTTHGAPEHRPSWWHFPKRVIRSLDWLTGRYLQKGIIAVSDDLADILKKYFPSDKITAIENGIDLNEIHDLHIKQRIYKAMPDNFRIGLAGRLTPVKRIDIFILTAQYLLEHHLDLNASHHIFGDGPIRNQLEHLSDQLRTNKIMFFEGHHENIHPSLQELDALVITSDHEGLPMILLEAIALQIPVIVHAVGGIPKVLNYGACGILVQRQCASDFGDAIYQLASSPQMRADIKRNALDRVTRHYSAEQNALSYASAYLAI